MKRIRRNNLWVLVILLIVAFTEESDAQTYQFSQFFNSFPLLNPSYTGITGHRYRAGILNRIQWVGLSGGNGIPFTTTAAFYYGVANHPLKDGAMNPAKEKQNSYFTYGISAFNNRQGNGALTHNAALLSLSWMKQIGESTYFAGGFDINYQQTSINNYVLVNDYLSGNNIVNAGDQVQYPNFSAGITLVFKNAWIGSSLKDIRRTPPDINFIAENLNFYDKLNIHGGFSFSVGAFSTFKSSASYKHWRNLRQLETGFGLSRNFSNGMVFSGSLGYRGLPKTYEGLGREDSFILMGGFNSVKIASSESGKNLGNLSIMISSDFYSFQFQKGFRTLEASIIWNAPYSRYVRKNCYDYSHGPMADQIAMNLYGGRSPYSKLKPNEKPSSVFGKKKRK